MSFQFTHPWFLVCALVALPWIAYWAHHSDVQIGPWRRGSALFLRFLITTSIILAMAGLQWLRPLEGMNLIYLLDRSESIPPTQKEEALQYVQKTLNLKESVDQAGVVVFGSEAALELPVLERNELPAVQSVIDSSRTDIGSAIRLATAAFPENGQKRIGEKFKMVDTTKRSKGLWFYGLSGSGKSFASSICKEFTTNAFVLDGDDVRKYVSTDLSYSESDRKVQTKRILGISKIVIENNMFPIISTVTMQSDLLNECDKLQIEVILLNRSMDQIHQVREIYKNESNVVGKDIFLQKFLADPDVCTP